MENSPQFEARPQDANLEPTPVATQRLAWAESFRVWSRVAALSFGGPAGQIAVMHRIVVEEKKWLPEDRFFHALNFCMLLPGPEAQQLATYIGWLLQGTRGALLAGLLFIFPGALAILALSIAYVTWGETPLVASFLFGLKPATLAIVVEAVWRVGKRVLKNRALATISAAAFVSLFFFHVPFPIVILAAGAIGALGSRFAPRQFTPLAHGKKSGAEASSPLSSLQPTMVLRDPPAPSLLRDLRVTAICFTLWFVPLACLRQTLGVESIFYKEAIFFSITAVVTFGGAYSVLSYVAQQAVENYGWLKSSEMLDGLGMAETTPGPLIMVVQFVGFLGAYRDPGPFSPLVAGILGSAVTTWVTFVPCFYWIFLGAPRIEQARRCLALASALTAITAAVVGVILNLALWFGLHVLFEKLSDFTWGPLRIVMPDLGSLKLGDLFLAIVAAGLIFVARRGMIFTLAVSCILGLIWRAAGL